MSDLIRRVRQVLADAELLSEGSTQSWDKSSPSADQDRSPKSQGEALRDSLCGDLMALVEKYDRKVKAARKQERKPATDEENRYWLIEQYSGVRDYTMAIQVGISVEEVWAIRRRYGREQRTGRERAA